ncbi:hypothetical protein ITX31_14735 [Arthrobacter gandavensis]|uniref:hypothetical protein n=1 Tax=Arthrobacter gandavensis TaxID=169960 RepID=UPI00188F3755|nr:hypothetical protein [Arthrobacter gandavensis]MBF4995359.1 hypothetical protein [Arthrobacter gandavensis]
MARWRDAFGPEGRPYRRILAAAAAAGSAAGVYLRLVRPLRRHAAPGPGPRMPGDAVLTGPVLQYTRSILIPAPAADIWPFLNRIGHGRAGWYVFDRVGLPDQGEADRAVPQLRDLEIGDLLSTGTGHRLRIKEVQPRDWMLWADGDRRSTWLWLLKPLQPGRTLLVVRARFQYGLRRPGVLASLPFDAVYWASLRRTMLTLRDRAVLRSATRLGKR